MMVEVSINLEYAHGLGMLKNSQKWYTKAAVSQPTIQWNGYDVGKPIKATVMHIMKKE